MPSTDDWNVGRLLQWTADFLGKHGSDSPRLDAELLLAQALGCKRIELYTAFDAVPGDQPRAAFRDLVRRRAEGARWPTWSATASFIRSRSGSPLRC